MNGRILGTVFASAILVLGLATWDPPDAAAQGTLEISLKDVGPFPYCAITHKGPFTDMPVVISELVGAMEAQGLLVRIRGPLVGVYYNWPGDEPARDLTWDAGFVVETQSTTRPPLMMKVWERQTVAAALHVGPYDGLGQTVDAIMDWLEAKGYDVAGPVLERYLDQNPSAVDPDKLRTEIWVPCTKK